MPYKNHQKRLEYHRIWGKTWRKNNPEKVKANRKRSYQKHIEKRRKEARERQPKIWKNCIVCGEKIFGVKKKKYCSKCRKEIRSKRLRGNKYWKLVKNRLKGKNHPSWKDGITFWKKRIWDSPKYKQWRKKVFERDDYTCQECGARSGIGKAVSLEAHHLISFAGLLREYNIKSKEEADKCDDLWNIALGQTLCYKCHQLTKHGKQKKFNSVKI